MIVRMYEKQAIYLAFVIFIYIAIGYIKILIFLSFSTNNPPWNYFILVNCFEILVWLYIFCKRYKGINSLKLLLLLPVCFVLYVNIAPILLLFDIDIFPFQTKSVWSAFNL